MSFSEDLVKIQKTVFVKFWFGGEMMKHVDSFPRGRNVKLSLKSMCPLCPRRSEDPSQSFPRRRNVKLSIKFMCPL
ncbi:MAG: hypothetical protein IJA52_01950, partial [Clostridia bacterium]|nr:hypothetical protein [Clostridia bacterium]